MFAGNTTAIASLLFVSAYSAQGDISAAAHNLSALIASAALPSAEQKQAITQTIQYAPAVWGPGALPFNPCTHGPGDCCSPSQSG